MQAPDLIQAALEQLFPKCVAVCFSADRPNTPQLLPEEVPATGKMVAARKLEYAHGRTCARAALQLLEVKASAIPTGENREPLWPAGIVGSISHTSTAAAAVAANETRLAGLGLDMETAEPLSADLVEMICRRDEDITGDGMQAKLLFSIKEAIYKCIYPGIQAFVDFQEMKVTLDAASQRFVAQAFTPVCDQQMMDRLEGAYKITEGLVLSGAWLRPPD
jgi:4'-phosphopantetheinyl transferase EntD